MSGMLNHHDPNDTKRLLWALIVVGFGLVLWQVLYEQPRMHQAQLQEQEATARQQQMEQTLKEQKEETLQADHAEAEHLAQSQAKVTIDAPEMTGAIALQGGRINYLKLLDYPETTAKDSPPVTLLEPSGVQAYFIEFGWLPSQTGSGIKTPNRNTVWQADSETLSKNHPVTLRWDNGQGLQFETKISLTDAYLFSIDQRVVNTSGQAVELSPYGLINRTFEGEVSKTLILHEGPLAVVNDTLEEPSYNDLVKDGSKRYGEAEGWLGITDKYWLTALIPHNDEPFTGKFESKVSANGYHHYQADFMGRSREIAPGQTVDYTSLVFAGAKQLEMLDSYAEKYNIPLFDRAVDLGNLYFLTKPLLKLLTLLYAVSGDFGMAIILLTFLVKLAMYPLANKSYVAMNEMKRLQPKITQMKERYGDDKMRFQQEMMGLYKKEKINPAAGCLPLFVQIPVFFSLYKVLFVTIEMRHAHFYNLIHDLSAKDPTNIFTLFGLIDWNPPHMLHLGIMPILMAITMWGQQQLNPKPTDPVQAKMMGWLPWVFMIILSSFPAGLILYWICSNMLSILQQWSIKHRYHRRKKKHAANDV